MYRFIARAAAGCLIASTVFAADSASVSRYVDQYLARQPVQSFKDITTADEAYAFQQQMNSVLVDRGYEPIGYKLGLTGSKRLFGAPEPLYGRIFDFMQRDNNARIPLSDFVRPLVELELAFRFKQDVIPPVDVKQLRQAIDVVAPAVELADMVFENPKTLSWQQLAASGVGPRRVIIGPPQPLDDLDLNAVQVKAIWNGEFYSRGYGRNVMGDQWQALLFLAERLNDQGLRIKSDDWVITGAMNRMLPARAGDYQVTYTGLGELTFSLTE